MDAYGRLGDLVEDIGPAFFDDGQRLKLWEVTLKETGEKRYVAAEFGNAAIDAVASARRLSNLEHLEAFRAMPAVTEGGDE
ncbi:hypothetical protein [Stratiformator vulcanicus]|uniref:Uncharacterized protein n=1 Tax=Stratiformator vulcanicus TaxID=2527980 RepID=A0A517R791_9PLAN|nr:hypothetical protein [Stratiformator vulcanicus]QDT39749.1 hypothetical protein Pan189_41580 [Stratiformator vulcanicus]